MAGSDANFNATEFRDAIHFAMNMGQPNDRLVAGATPTTVVEKAIFQWNTARTYVKQDPANKPYTWTADAVTTTSHADVSVPVAMDFPDRQSEDNSSIGQFDNSRAILTLLDVDYVQVVGADTVLLGGNTYNIDFVAPPVALFEVNVYTIFVQARDES